MMDANRERIRRELISLITDAARRQLAEVGPSTLSLRAVARELGLASSALYRYFPSRDALLTALIVDGYDALGEAAEGASCTARRTRPGARWLQVCRACRRWALAHPHEFALLYGSPVPGYAAPETTTGPAGRVIAVMAQVLRDAHGTDDLRPPRQQIPHLPLVTPEVIGFAGLAQDPAYTDLVERSLVLWVVLMGSLSFELFGHLENVVTDRAAWFDASMAVAAEGVGLRVPMGARR